MCGMLRVPPFRSRLGYPAKPYKVVGTLRGMPANVTENTECLSESRNARKKTKRRKIYRSLLLNKGSLIGWVVRWIQRGRESEFPPTEEKRSLLQNVMYPYSVNPILTNNSLLRIFIPFIPFLFFRDSDKNKRVATGKSLLQKRCWFGYTSIYDAGIHPESRTARRSVPATVTSSVGGECYRAFIPLI